MRAILNREATVRLRVDDDSGALVAPEATPTLTVTDADGESVTPGTVDEITPGVYASVLPPQDVLTTLTVNWTYALSGVERQSTEVVRVVADRLVPLWRYREADDLSELDEVNMPRLADTVEDWMRSALDFPVTREYDADTLVLDRDTKRLRLPRAPYPVAVRAVTIDGQAQDVEDFTVASRAVTYEAGWRAGTVVEIAYEHGPSPDFAAGSPGNIVRAAVILARYANRTSNYPERARQVATEGALITFSTPSPDRPTGLPEVDTVVARYQLRAYL